MSSKGKLVYGSSLHRWTLTIIVLCAVVWRVSADALAQDAAPTPLKMARSTSRSSGGPETNTAPHLIIYMADRVNTQFYGSLRLAREEAPIRFARNTISRPVGSEPSVNRSERRDPGPVLLSNTFAPTAGVRGLTDYDAEGTNGPQVIQRSHDQASAKVCSLLDDAPALGSSIHEYRIKYSLSKQWLTDNDSFTHEKSSSVRPSSSATSRTMKQAAAIILIFAISRSSHGN